MSDIHDRVAERIAMAIMGDGDGHRILAKRRVRVVSGGEEPTIEHYRLALEQCIAEKAADWRAACQSAAAASSAIGELKAELARLRLTDAEREAIQTAIDILTDPVCRVENKQTEALRALLARLGGAS